MHVELDAGGGANPWTAAAVLGGHHHHHHHGTPDHHHHHRHHHQLHHATAAAAAAAAVAANGFHPHAAHAPMDLHVPQPFPYYRLVQCRMLYRRVRIDHAHPMKRLWARCWTKRVWIYHNVVRIETLCACATMIFAEMNRARNNCALSNDIIPFFFSIIFHSYRITHSIFFSTIIVSAKHLKNIST